MDTPLIRLRLLIADSDPAKQKFTDDELNLFLTMAEGDVYGAAEQVCLTTAADKARLGKFTLEGFADNEAAAAGLFLRLAEKYAAKVGSSDDTWDVVEWPVNAFARRRKALS